MEQDFSEEDLRYVRLLRAFVLFLLRFERDSLVYVQQMQDQGLLEVEEADLLRFHLNYALNREGDL